MKVIDLLNKIANGEEVPNEIKYCGVIFTFNNENCNFLYKYQVGKCQLFGCCKLNDEVEIIEDTPKEDKKIEKIGLPVPGLSPQLIFLATKINELIEKANGE